MLTRKQVVIRKTSRGSTVGLVLAPSNLQNFDEPSETIEENSEENKFNSEIECEQVTISRSSNCGSGIFIDSKIEGISVPLLLDTEAS